MDYAQQPAAERTLTDDIRDEQGSKSGWTADQGAGQGNAARCDELGYFDGIDASGGATESTSELVAMFDQLVPQGLGVQLSGAIELVAGVAGGIEVACKAVNLSGGWLEVESKWAGALGLELGDPTGSVHSGGTYEKAITYRVPWAGLVADPARIGQVLGSMCGTSAPEAVEALLHFVVPGVDLNPYVIREEVTAGMESGSEVKEMVLGVEFGWIVEVAPSVTVAMEYDDVVDAQGKRTGHIELGGGFEALNQVVVKSKSMGDLGIATPLVEGATGLEIDFEENAGTKTVTGGRATFDSTVGAGSAALAVSGSLGTDGAKLTLASAIPSGDLWWGLVAGAVMAQVPGAEALGVELSPESEIALQAEVNLGQLLAGSAALLADVARYVATGQCPEVLQDVRADLDAAIAACTVTIPVAASLMVGVSAGEKTGTGLIVGGSAEGSVGLVYETDDILPLLAAAPTPEEVLGRFRAQGASSANA